MEKNEKPKSPYFPLKFALMDCLIKAEKNLPMTHRQYLNTVFDFWNLKFFVEEFHIERKVFLALVGANDKKTISAIGKALQKKGFISYKAQANGNTKIEFTMGESYWKFVQDKELRKESVRMNYMQPTGPAITPEIPKKEPVAIIPSQEDFIKFIRREAGIDYDAIKNILFGKFELWKKQDWRDGVGNPIGNAWEEKMKIQIAYLLKDKAASKEKEPSHVSTYKLNEIVLDEN